MGDVLSDVVNVGSFGLVDLGDITGENQQEQAIALQQQQNARDRELQAQLAEQARQDLFRLFPGAEEARNLGFQGALDVFGQTIPQQIQAFQQGNVGAQQQLSGALPSFQNSILGLPQDFGAFQPQRLNIDTSFAQQQLPNFPSLGSQLSVGQEGAIGFNQLPQGQFNLNQPPQAGGFGAAIGSAAALPAAPGPSQQDQALAAIQSLFGGGGSAISSLFGGR